MSIQEYTLISQTGFEVGILNLGGVITRIMAKDKSGKRENVVLSYDNHEDYLSNPFFLGCFVGPVAGRTQNGHLQWEENGLTLDTSLDKNALHSGKDGLHNQLWTVTNHHDSHLEMTLTASLKSKPETEIHYILTYTIEDESLFINYRAYADQETYLSLTNHTYFNLSGNLDQSIEAHRLHLKCSHFAEIDDESLPQKLTPLEGSEFDFTQPQSIGEILEHKGEQVKAGNGIDHPFKTGGNDPAAILMDPVSGRQLSVHTSQPYMVIYTGNFLDADTSPSGQTFVRRSGICFETQDLPNVVNNHLDKVVTIGPDKDYIHQTVFDFAITE